MPGSAEPFTDGLRSGRFDATLPIDREARDLLRGVFGEFSASRPSLVVRGTTHVSRYGNTPTGSRKVLAT
ncbi:hypothetical protein M0E87_06990 [Corynebacterium sp. CCM 9185]|uniref:Uncharacterized protein n=1 Tax=Corynebacterium marambiense TaxID=2765364 RepID=A0ABS0VUL3_9CORY|nr:hypothetical protein [Corynebacterium marambiense]MBI9000051.1 hypothetical protein [Corynebacterium marambiense]MCK7663403.1 hypothetical protein [Corynebacterium marambiense]MCX7542160.1 hypothetical protein [Corynebacterium marambiense]